MIVLSHYKEQTALISDIVSRLCREIADVRDTQGSPRLNAHSKLAERRYEGAGKDQIRVLFRPDATQREGKNA